MQKNLRFDDDMLKKFDELKEKLNIKSDSELARKMIDCLYESDDVVKAEKYEELQKQYQALLVKCGELQGELNVFKQLAIPQKPGKRWWQFWKK
jgi:hypothetical protein